MYESLGAARTPFVADFNNYGRTDIGATHSFPQLMFLFAVDDQGLPQRRASQMVPLAGSTGTVFQALMEDFNNDGAPDIALVLNRKLLNNDLCLVYLNETPPACSPTDFAPPFSVLDEADVQELLNLLGEAP